MPMFAVFATTAAEMAAAEAAAAAAATAATTTAAAAPTLAATTAAAAPTMAGIMGGSGALAPAVGATEVATAAPQIAGTASTLAQASPEIASNLAAGNAPGIMQAMTPEAVQQTATSMGSGFPMPSAQTGAVPMPPAGELPNTGIMQPAGDVLRNAQGIPQAPFDNVGPTLPENPILPGNETTALSNVPMEAPPAASGESAFDRGLRVATDFAKSAYKEYKESPAPLQYLGAGLAAKKLGLFDQKQQEPKKYKSMTNMSGFQPSVPPFAPTGRTGYADGGPVEAMSNMNAGIATAPGMNTTGENLYYPMAQQQHLAYINPGVQNPVSQNVLDVGEGGKLDPYTGMPAFADGGDVTVQPDYKKMLSGKSPDELHRDAARAKATAEAGGFGIIPRSRAQQLSSPGSAAQAEMAAMMKKYGIKSALPKVKDLQGSMADVEEAAGGGIMYNLGGYSDGGRLLKGPGNGTSDSIPASIGNKQPARLADGEFVIPARIVSELGNGSTEAGAKELYAMMDRVQKARGKTVGKGKVAVDAKARNKLPA